MKKERVEEEELREREHPVDEDDLWTTDICENNTNQCLKNNYST